MQNIKTKDVIAYATLPRVIPRFKALFLSGFNFVAYLIAQVFFMVRLLPRNHPYLSKKNMGRYGIRHVLGQAANNLVFKRENIDQIIIFFVILSGLVILSLQLLLLAYALLVKPVFAGAFFFNVDVPAKDISYNILDQIVGVPDLFCSSVTPANCTDNNPIASGTETTSAFYNAIHDLFKFYSTGLLLIGTLIFLYFIFVLVLETAVSGSPFGQRFQNVWVPVRLVMAVGLLMPLGYGLNSAQYITLYTAKYGSALATRSWTEFNRAVTLHPIFGATLDPEDSIPVGEKYTLLAVPQQLDLNGLVGSMALIHACAYSYLWLYESTADTGSQGAGKNPPHYIYGDYTTDTRDYKIKPWLVKTKSDWMDNAGLVFLNPPVTIDPEHRGVRWEIESATDVSYLDALTFYFGSDVIIRFGEYATNETTGEPLYKDYDGEVKPFCGDIRIPITSLKNMSPDAPGDGPEKYGAAAYMFKAYYNLVLEMWFTDQKFRQFARSYLTYTHGEGTQYADQMCGAGAAGISGCDGGGGFPACAKPACDTTPIDANFKVERVNFYRQKIDTAIRTAWGLYVKNGTDSLMTAKTLECGWACAGSWFNKLAEINGMFMDGVRNMPQLSTYPLAMEQVRAEKNKIDMNVIPKNQFDPSVRAMSGQESPKLEIDEGDLGLEVAGMLNSVYKFFSSDTLNQGKDDARATGNAFIDVMNALFGTEGLMNMRGANRHLHPLAQLVATGKSLVNNAIEKIGFSSITAFASGFFEKSGSPTLASASEAVSRMLLSMAFLGLMVGLVLFYVLPFLPFLYFFFALGTWIKTIFEAMVGTPLWALAHLRIDGEGLPGDAASNGYFLLLEIFIRPILTIFGLIAALTILSAQVNVLNLIWDVVVANTGGFTNPRNDIFWHSGMAPDPAVVNVWGPSNKRSIIDQFFFTVVYAIICYMLALASFKLIDQIPNNMLRWAGSGVSAFGDINQENASGLTSYVSQGAMSIGQDAADAIRTGARGLGSGLGSAVSTMGKSGGP